MENSKISWTTHTWNPWLGCRHVSAECDHCYADRMVTVRMGKDFSTITRAKTTWKKPLKWNREAPALAAELGGRVRVFCASLTDFFIQDADAWRDEAWDVIRQCTELDWLILTKRPQLIPSRLPKDWGEGWPHVWLGTTCGVKESYPRLDSLRKIPAVVRFISAEPLLESLNDINLDGFNWLIAGGESGSGFRPMREEWAMELRDICVRERVGFHFKQHSDFRSGSGPELCGKQYHEPPLVQIAIGPAAEQLVSPLEKIRRPAKNEVSSHQERTHVAVTQKSTVTKTKSRRGNKELLKEKMAAKQNTKAPTQTGQNPVSAATVNSIRLNDKEKALVRKDTNVKRKAYLKSLEADAQAFVKRYRTAKEINDDAIVLHRKFKDIVEEMRPVFKRVKVGFAHLNNGETVMGERTGPAWAKKYVGVTYDWLCRCLKPPKVGTLLLTDGTTVVAPTLSKTDHASKEKASLPALTQTLPAMPPPLNADWTDNDYIKTCVQFVQSTIKPLECDPARFVRVAEAIAEEIVGEMRGDLGNSMFSNECELTAAAR